jgi:hypothetical protein
MWDAINSSPDPDGTAHAQGRAADWLCFWWEYAEGDGCGIHLRRRMRHALAALACATMLAATGQALDYGDPFTF